MSTGIENSVHYLHVPASINETVVPQLKKEIDQVLGDVIDNGFDKFVLDLSELSKVTQPATQVIFKAMEDCATLKIRVRIVASNEFARMCFGLDKLDKISIFRDRMVATLDFK